MVMTQPVPAPLAGPPRFGLLVAANVLRDPARWAQGYTFTPEACNAGGTYDPCGAVEFDVERGRPDDVLNVPFGVWAGDKCGVDSDAEQDGRARARRALEANESQQIAAEFWTGALSTASAWDNQHLAAGGDVNIVGGAGEPIARAVQLLHTGLGAGQGNRRGMIHVTLATLDAMVAADLVRRDGNLWVTSLDHIVVTDAGYPGTSPAGVAAADDATWAYATGLVTVRLSEVEVLPPEDDRAAAFSTRVNDLTFVAHRLASPAWDGCALVGVSIDLTL